MTVTTFILAAVITGAAGIVGTVLGASIEHIFQIRSEREARGDVARHAQADRLRQKYVDVMGAARACQQTAHELNYLFEGESREERDQRLARTLTKAVQRVEDALAAIAIEPGAPDLDAIFRPVYARLVAHAGTLRYSSQHPGSVPADELTADLDAIDDGVSKLTSAIHAHLQSLMP